LIVLSRTTRQFHYTVANTSIWSCATTSIYTITRQTIVWTIYK